MADSRWVKLLTTILGPPSGSGATWGVQELEDTFDDLLLGRAIGTAAGRQLEGIGEILGLSRTSTDDEEYRDDLRLQAAINNSHGRPEEVLSVASRLRNVSLVVLLEHPLARFFLHLLGDLPTVGTRARLRQMKGGGIAMDILASGSTNPFVFGFDMDALGVGAVPPGEDPDGSGFGEAYPVTAVLVGGPGAGAFYVAGDCTTALVVADSLSVQGSTNNDGAYTIAALTFEPGPVRTRIDVAEAVAAVADGAVLDGGAGSGDFCDVF